MTGGRFDADWLRLRESVDHRSRDRGLVHELRREGRRRGWRRVVDLGSGTGSNLRYLSARIPWAREWTAVDHDAALLRAVTPVPPHTVRRVLGDLATEGLGAVDGCDVVTASALLDLVSEAWLTALRDRCVDVGCGAYFALTYDGSIGWQPADEADALVLEAVNEHQRSDKGLGTALGPDAGALARRVFDDAGYETRLEASPWLLSSPGDTDLVRLLVEGWVDAAVELRPDEGDGIRGWAERRVRDFSEGRTRLRVGHVDLLALPPRA